jgi:hypothetical protein
VNRFTISIFFLVIVLISPNKIIPQVRDTSDKQVSIEERIADSLSRQKDVLDLINKILKSHFSSKPDSQALKPDNFLFAFVYKIKNE